MYLRAGFFSLGLLLLSRVLGLARESVQAAAFGATGVGDVVIVMFTLPDLLVGIFLSGALAYVLLPHWAGQSITTQNASQKKVACTLLLVGVAAGFLIWLLRGFLVAALAPGLTGEMRALGQSSLVWSAAGLPLAAMAALWTTRLQHERDFIGMYAGNLLVNMVLVAALFLMANAAGGGAGTLDHMTTMLGLFLLLAMVLRLAWLAWRVRRRQSQGVVGESDRPLGDSYALRGTGSLPGASVWVWAALSSGLLLILPIVGRSIASQGGEGALANFNYAWKLIELPLVLAVQLVASVAFPAITRTQAGTPGRERALQVAFLLAWSLACAAVAVVATFSFPLASLLFGWGKMDASKLAFIAEWSAIGVWSLLAQAVIAVLLTVMAISNRMHVAVWVYCAALVALVIFGTFSVAGVAARGAFAMWMLDAVLATVAMVLLVTERRSLRRSFPWQDCITPLLACVLLVLLKPWFAGLSLPFTMIMCGVYALLVLSSAVLASSLLRSLLLGMLRRSPTALTP
jgi:putative peptidoglycan lipid II flippase